MSGDFSLRALIRQIRDELGSGDRHLIAKKAAPRIPDEHREAAFLEALAEVARDVVKNGHPRVHPAPSPVTPLPGMEPKTGRANAARSSKVAAIRRVWPELRATYQCLDPNKQLADYSGDDLIFVADHLERQARQNAAKAGNYRKLAAHMAGVNAARVSDLPDDVLAAVFRGEAA